MTWKKYAVSVLIFSGVGLVFLFLLQLVQGVLPGNPQHLSGVKWDLAFNTSASFIIAAMPVVRKTTAIVKRPHTLLF